MDAAIVADTFTAGSYLIHLLSHYGIGFASAVAVIAVIRGVGWIQERVLPVLDETRDATAKALRDYVSGDAQPAQPVIVAAAILGGAILCGTTLLAVVMLAANFSTPLG